jgi:5-(carboxyamino)imidazole ribonucleotide synthase
MRAASTSVGVVGGGQLARMLGEAASPLGVHLVVLAGERDEGADEVVVDVRRGAPDDPEALRALAAAVDVVTFDHENVDHATLTRLEAEGHPVRPSVATMEFADKAHQRRRFSSEGLPVPPFEVVGAEPSTTERRSTSRFVERHGAVVAKSSRGGYDGRGVWMLEASEVPSFLDRYRGAPLVIEPRLELLAELAVLVARRPSGETATWPTFETVQVGGMCDEVVYPAPVPEDLDRRAREVATEVAEITGSVGVLAVELFVVAGPAGADLLINEIAPRVHNSGHLTIEGSVTSQFEQHLRAILDWPLGPTSMLAPAVAMANVVGGETSDPRDNQAVALEEVPEAHLHLYGKMPRPGRKVGHVTVLGEDRERARQRAALAAEVLGARSVSPGRGSSTPHH